MNMVYVFTEDGRANPVAVYKLPERKPIHLPADAVETAFTARYTYTHLETVGRWYSQSLGTFYTLTAYTVQ